MTSRAPIAALWVCLAAPAGVALAQTTLPPPPYAAQADSAPAPSETSARMRGAAPVYDRYGGGVVHAPITRAATPYPALNATRAAPVYTGPRLAWDGKTAETKLFAGPTPLRTAQARAPYAPPPAASHTRLQYPSMAMAETAPAAAMSAPTPAIYTPPVYAPPVYASRTQQAAAPTSIYDPAPPSSAPVISAASQTPTMPGPPVRPALAASGDGPRLYSLHRDYGMAPDPIPLAPQFFGPTADLTAPETPEVGHRTTTSTGATRNAPTDASGDQ